MPKRVWELKADVTRSAILDDAVQLFRKLHLNPKQRIASEKTRCGGDLFHQLINVPPSLLYAPMNVSARERSASSTKMANSLASWPPLKLSRWPVSAHSTS